MRALLPYFKGYQWPSVLSPLFKLFEALLELAVPLIVAAIIDQAIPESNQSLLITYIGLMFLVALIGLAFSLSGQHMAAKAATGFTNNLGQDLFRKITRLPKAQREKMGPSSLVTRMSSDLYQILMGLNIFFRLFLRSPFIVFGSLAMAFTIDYRMTLYFLGMVVLLFVIVLTIIYLTSPLHQFLRKEIDRLVNLTREQIRGIRVIRAFAQEKREIEDFDTVNQSITQNQLAVGRLSVLTNPLTYVVVNLTLVFILWQGGGFIYEGSLSQGQLVALVNYLLQILVELVKLTNVVIIFNRTAASGQRIIKVLELEEEAVHFDNGTINFMPCLAEDSADASSKNPKTQTSDKQLLAVFENVSFTYPESSEAALQKLSFKIFQGQTFGITGSTGAGKSTVIQLLTKSYDQTQGLIHFNPDLMNINSRESLRSNISVVLQDARLFKGTIRSNLQVAKPDASEAEMWQALEDAEVTNFIKEDGLGLDSPVEAFGRNFSGGQRQRLTIARALVRPAQLIIFDAATSALDYLTEARIQQTIREKYQDRTLVIISERTQSIQNADQILVLEEGVQVGLGRHEDLLESNNIYREIFQSQQVLEVGHEV